jgi:putative spermidine/putrescine transport system ATP-binding protein
VAEAYLRLRGLAKTYPGADSPAVSGVDLDVRQGEMVALLGPSGCGKTTTLRMVAGLIEPTAGEILLDGKEIGAAPVHKRGMGMVFQSYALFPHLTVARNVAFGLETRGVPKPERQRRVIEALELVRLGQLADRRIGQLSGGQQQRVALARALVVQPTVLLLDEPMSNLDAKLRDAMRTEIRELQQRTGTTALFVTHDQDEALSMADVVAVMSDGVVEQVGTPEEVYERPRTRFVAEFIGRANLLDVDVVGPDGDRLHVRLADGTTLAVARNGDTSDAGVMLLRPHRLRIEPAGPEAPATGLRLAGVVESRSYTGEAVGYRVRCGEQVITVERPTGGEAVVEPGTRVSLSYTAADARLLAR